MKRIIALMLIAVLAISMVGCSDEDDKGNGGTSTGSSQAVNNSDNDSDDSSDSGDSVNYAKYDDLPNYVRIIFHEIYISTPAWRQDDVVNAYNLTNSTNYVISVAFNIDEEYTGAIEDIVDDTYDEFTGAIGEHAVTNEFGEYNLTAKEKVTLDCGAEAMRFEGTMSANQYSSVVDYYVYGYSFVYDGATVTVGTSIVNPDAIDANKDTLKDIIDRMVKTIRTQA